MLILRKKWLRVKTKSTVTGHKKKILYLLNKLCVDANILHWYSYINAMFCHTNAQFVQWIQYFFFLQPMTVDFVNLTVFFSVQFALIYMYARVLYISSNTLYMHMYIYMHVNRANVTTRAANSTVIRGLFCK